MRYKTFTVLTALLLFLATPLLAQMADDPMQNEEVEAQQVETQEGVETSASAELQATDDPSVEADAQLSAEVSASDETSGSETEESLPQTASPLALLALLGTAGAGSALGLRRLRK